jgi:hypothetical protein
MPFVKIDKGVGKPKGKFIRLNEKWRTMKIWNELAEKYFPNNRVEIYVDSENELIGLKPVDKGGFLMHNGKVTCNELFNKYPVKSGLYPAEWSEKDGMLIAKIRFMRESKPE